jgi:hypothetical protein
MIFSRAYLIPLRGTAAPMIRETTIGFLPASISINMVEEQAGMGRETIRRMEVPSVQIINVMNLDSKCTDGNCTKFKLHWVGVRVRV